MLMVLGMELQAGSDPLRNASKRLYHFSVFLNRRSIFGNVLSNFP